MSDTDQKKYSMDDFKNLFSLRLQELVEAYLHDNLERILQSMVDRVMDRQRKDVADELVRILLEKALKESK